MTYRQMKFIPAALLLALTLSGCGSSNDESPAVSAAGKHPSNWYTAHRKAYSIEYMKDQAMQCRDCHGLDLMGGITRIDCFNGIPGQKCHAGGHGPRAVPHPMPYTDPSAHGPVAKADLIFCQDCHGQAGGPGTNPRFNVAIGSLTQGCTPSGCHNSNSPTQFRYTSAAHPIAWTGHKTAGNLLNACGLCHGQLLTGGVGQSCINCHTGMLPGVPPVSGECVSCHAKPPANGSHLAHNDVASLANQCTACHYGAGSGSALHDNGTVNFAFNSTFNAKSGPAVKNPDNSCSNVSCHGGLITYPWGGSSLNPGLDDRIESPLSLGCRACHSNGTGQYNAYNSGEHLFHLNKGLWCTDCHDMNVTNAGNGHFSNLATPAFELSPSLTIRTPVRYIGGSCTPDPNNTTNGFQYTNGCHDAKNW